MLYNNESFQEDDSAFYRRRQERPSRNSGSGPSKKVNDFFVVQTISRTYLQSLVETYHVSVG